MKGIKIMSRFLLFSLSILFVLSAGIHAQDVSSKVIVPFFGNATCPITGEPTKPDLFVKMGEERIFVCCKACVAKVSKDLEGNYKKAYPAEKAVDLKNAKCPIMGGDVKEGVTTTFQGHTVHFCCPGCDKKFRKEPNKHLAILTSKKKLTDLGNTQCPVLTKEKVSLDSFVIYGDQIVNLCCSDCVKDFSKDPEKYLKALQKPADSDPKKKGDEGDGHPDHGTGGSDHKVSNEGR